MIDIHPKETCDCPRPLPDGTYMRYRRCKLCGYLIPRSAEHRARLAVERQRIYAKEGLAPKLRPPLDERGSKGVLTRLLKDDAELTNADLLAYLSRNFTCSVSDRKLLDVITLVRATLDISNPGKGGGRPKKRVTCLYPGCYNVPYQMGFCRKCLRREEAA